MFHSKSHAGRQPRFSTVLAECVFIHSFGYGRPESRARTKPKNGLIYEEDRSSNSIIPVFTLRTAQNMMITTTPGIQIIAAAAVIGVGLEICVVRMKCALNLNRKETEWQN
ncbi:hypothetical protein SASPL_106777 [Salvia splendens]|uniref:Uncharacterized protein n=1 Tax=Salvia splendens TaxID=180675 RepID=A0A8X8YMG6_SALSN|nr:hypothetical protein SASPL_106777 [Salvia splendens]